MKLDDKDLRMLRSISNVAVSFTLIVSLMMIFSLIQLKRIDPLENPALITAKAQYDRDPSNAQFAQQVRALDLMARKVYFSSRWQIETGSYLLLAGAIIFIICQRLITGNEKAVPPEPGPVQDSSHRTKIAMNSLMAAAVVIFITAIFASFALRKNVDFFTFWDKKMTTKIKNRAKTASFKPDETNFPFFRGQDSRGIAGGNGYPLEWNGPEGHNIKWKTFIPKPGKSSPVVWDNKIFLTGAEGLQCEVYCVDKESGNIIWTASASDIPGEPSELPKMDMESGMAVSTVATNGNVVCAVFANGNLLCTDLDGRIKWSKNIGIPENIYGYSSSLIIYENILHVKYDDDAKIALMGFETETGELKWEMPRTGRPTWSSPVIGYFNNKAQVIISGNPNVTGFDAETGMELWSVECLSGDVAPSVAVNSTMVYAVTDYSNLAAIRPGPGASVIWEDYAFTPDVSSPVANDELLFLSTGNGDVACYYSERGDTAWTHWFRDQFYASPVLAEDKVYLLDRSGVMHIVSASPEFKVISESPVGEATDCTPAFSDGEIFIRSMENLYCISKN